MISDRQILALQMGLEHQIGGAATDVRIMRADDPTVLRVEIHDSSIVAEFWMPWHDTLSAAEMVSRLKQIIEMEAD